MTQAVTSGAIVRKIVRCVGWLFAIVTVLMGLAMLATRTYLSSDAAKQLASDKLTTQFGTPVVVHRLSAGWTGSTMLALELPATPGIGAGTEPLFAATVTANVSAVGLALGKTPTEITIENATLTLHFDRVGHLLDPLPEPQAGTGGAFPTIHIWNATVRLVQEERPDFRVSGAGATITPRDAGLSVSGFVDDKAWGSWLVDGELARDGSTGDLHLVTEGLTKVTMTELRSLPVVSPAVWKTISLHGETTGSVRLTRPPEGNWGYHVVLQPHGTTLELMPLNLTVTDATAHVEIEGLRVTVVGLQGQSAGGAVTADAVGDFGQEPEVITLNVAATDVDVTRLPRKWTAKLPPLEEGRLRATAELVLKLQADGVETLGRGTGHVSGKFLGGSADVAVELVGDGGTLEIRPPAKAPE